MVREGETLRVAGAGSRWKVAMAEPVLQGVVKKGYTRFLVLPPTSGAEDFEDDEALDQHAEPETTTSSGDEDSAQGAEDSEEDGDDNFEIDEAFLAASVLSAPQQSLPPTPLSPPPPTSSNALALTNGHSTFPLASGTSSKPAASAIKVVAQSLQRPIPSPLLVPRPRDDEDDTPRVYLRTRDLGRLGLFSGDWVVLGSGDESSEERRLARAFAGEGLLDETAGTVGCVSSALESDLTHC